MIAQVIHRWESYWFKLSSLFNLAVVRILVVGFYVVWLLTQSYPDQLARSATLPDFVYEPLPIFRLLSVVFGTRPDLAVLNALFVIALVAGIAALIGVLTNLSVGIFAICSFALQSYIYSFGEYHHPEAIVLLALAILAFSPCGAVLSVDSYFNRKRLIRRGVTPANILDAKSIYARWPLLLIQWLFVFVYLSAAVAKTVNGRGLWTNGYTMQFILLQDGLWWNVPLAVSLSSQHTLAMLMSIFAVVFETTFVLPVIFPVLRWIYIPAGLAMHASIYILQRAQFFSFMLLYCVFVPWDKVVRLLIQKRLPQAQPELTISQPQH